MSIIFAYVRYNNAITCNCSPVLSSQPGFKIFRLNCKKKLFFSSESFAYVAQIRFLKNGYNSVIIYFL